MYINILGINLTKLDYELFGKNKNTDLKIYNRFYRMVLKSGLGYFFKKYNHITIDKIYHHRGDQSSDDLFPWHSIYKIDFEHEKITIKEKEIQFIDSDHRKTKIQESNFIQLIDLALGATFCCLHGISNNMHKIQIGRSFKPTLTTLLDRKKAPYSNAWIGSYYRSRYYRTYQVSFFPKTEIDLKRAMNQLDVFGDAQSETTERNNIYYDRPLILGSPSPVQTGLNRWF